MEPKKSYRTNRNKMICGVCQGLSEYINIDPTVIRLLWVVFGFTGVGIFAYVAAAIIMPVEQ